MKRDYGAELRNVMNALADSIFDESDEEILADAKVSEVESVRVVLQRTLDYHPSVAGKTDIDQLRAQWTAERVRCEEKMLRDKLERLERELAEREPPDSAKL